MMLSGRGDTEVIYLKDEEFLPRDVEVRLGTLVRFVNVHNHDSFEGSNQSPNTAYNKVVIECKGLFSFSLDSIPSSPSLRHRHSKNYSNEAFFTFIMSGKYQLTSPTIPKMKCIITVIEMEAMPPQKALYFPTAKDREKQAIISNTLTLTQDNDQIESARLDTKDCSGSGNTSDLNHHDGHNSDWSSARKSLLLDEIEGSTPRRKATSNITHIAAVDRGGDGRCDDGDSDDEVDNILKERHYYKSLKRNYVNVKSPADWNKRSSPKSPPSKSPSKSPVDIQTPRRPSHTTSQHPIITVDIEDYSFSRSFVEVKANQRIQFRLSKDVPLHAEHLLFGESTNKALRFEAPLLQQLEETSFTFTPQSGGEVKVSCKIYPEMVCTILVHADAELTSPRPSSTVEVELRLGKSVTKSSTLQLSLEQLHQRAGGGEWSESQSSFLDSDDMFSCSDSPEKVSSRRARSGWTMLPTPTTPALVSSTMATSAQSTASKDIVQLSAKKSAQDKVDHLFLRAYRRKFFTSDDDSRNNSDSSGMFSSRREEHRTTNNKSRMKLNFRSDNLHQSDDALDGSDDSDSSDFSDTLYHNALTPSKKKRIDLTRKVPQSLQHRNNMQDKQSLRQNSGYEHIRYSNSKKSTDNAPQRHILVIEEFAFKPNNLIISSGDIVEFCKANAEVSNVSLSCEGEFDSLVVDNAALLPSGESKVSHTFCSVGVYTITNEVYNFMQCKVTVNKNSALSNNSQDPPVSKPNEVVAQSTTPRLIGSFTTVNKNLSPRTSPLSKPISNELIPGHTSPKSAVVMVPTPRGQGLPAAAPLYGSFSNLDGSAVARDLSAAVADDAHSIDDNGDDSDGKVTDTDENVDCSNINSNNLIALSHKEKKKLKSRLKKKLKKKKNKEINANLDGQDDNSLTKESNEYLPLANIVSDVNEEVNVVGATVVLSPECLSLATGVPSTRGRGRDQDYFYMMLAASADLVAECDGDSENDSCDHELIVNAEKASTSYYAAPEHIDHPSNLSIQVVNAIVQPEGTFTTETSSSTIDKCMDIFTALPLALNNAGLHSVEAVESVEAEAGGAISSSHAPGTLISEVDHSLQNAKKKKKSKKKSKKKKKQIVELDAEGELLLATAGDGDDNDDEDGNEDDDKAVEMAVINLDKCEVVPTRCNPLMEAHEAVARLQDGDSEILAQAESLLPFSRDVDVTSTAVPRVEEKEVSCEDKNLVPCMSSDEILGKVEFSPSFVDRLESDRIQDNSVVEVCQRDLAPDNVSTPSQKSHSRTPPPSPQSPPVTPPPPPPSFSADKKGYAPVTVDKTSTQLLRNALFSPASSTTKPSPTTVVPIKVVDAGERLFSNVVDSDSPKPERDLPPHLQNDERADQPEEKGLTVEELTNSMHDLEDFFYTRWACFQSNLDMASTDERVVYLNGPKAEVDNYHTYTNKRIYSSGRKRSKKR